MSDWLRQSASDLGRGIAAGKIDPVALTETYLAAGAAHPFGPRIYVRMTPERALAEAESARQRAKAGLRRGLLDGVPISWKDLFDTAGIVTEAGSMLLEGRVPEADAAVLQRATQAGTVCLGKTHMSELAFAGLGVNPAYGGNTDPKPGTPPNLHDPALAPGGSSSGAAASVAFGLAAAGIGSDTGGSVRVPAAWNDLVGLKTTHGRLSLQGVVPLAESFDTIGPLCRTVEDCAQLLAVMEGASPPICVAQPYKAAGSWFWSHIPAMSARTRRRLFGGSRAIGESGRADRDRHSGRHRRGDGAVARAFCDRGLWHMARCDRGRTRKDVFPHP